MIRHRGTRRRWRTLRTTILRTHLLIFTGTQSALTSFYNDGFFANKAPVHQHVVPAAVANQRNHHIVAHDSFAHPGAQEHRSGVVKVARQLNEPEVEGRNDGNAISQKEICGGGERVWRKAQSVQPTLGLLARSLSHLGSERSGTHLMFLGS